MTTASIYVRNSKAIGARNMSQAGMVDECRALAVQEGLQVVATHIDNGLSGAIRDRPAFLAWLADAEDGRAEVLISWAGDRLTREGINVAGRIMDVVEGKDPDSGKVVREPVRLLTYDDGIDSSQGDYWRRRLGDGAENARAERGRMSRRSLATRKRLKDAGKWASGPAPYGTRLDADRRLEVDPAERDVLRDVAQRLLQGQSMRQVLLWMNEEGLTTRRGNPWTRSSLTTTLESETSRDKIYTLVESRALAERLHPKPGMRPKGGQPIKWLLSGYATCAGCERPMTTSRDKKRGVTRYVCPTTSSVAPCEARATIRADRVDALVEEQYLAAWGDLHWWDEIVEVDGQEVDIAERERDNAQAVMLDDPSDENVARFRETRLALDAALSKPVVRTRKLVEAETYGAKWEKAVITDPETGEKRPDTSARAAMIRQATRSIEIARSTAPTWDPSRIRIDWTHEGDPVEPA
jgi:site-specific DNA recombinase